MNKKTKGYFEKNPHILEALVKSGMEEALKRGTGKPVQIVEKPRETSTNKDQVRNLQSEDQIP